MLDHAESYGWSCLVMLGNIGCHFVMFSHIRCHAGSCLVMLGHIDCHVVKLGPTGHAGWCWVIQVVMLGNAGSF